MTRTSPPKNSPKISISFLYFLLRPEPRYSLRWSFVSCMVSPTFASSAEMRDSSRFVEGPEASKMPRTCAAADFCVDSKNADTRDALFFAHSDSASAHRSDVVRQPGISSALLPVLAAFFAESARLSLNFWAEFSVSTNRFHSFLRSLRAHRSSFRRNSRSGNDLAIGWTCLFSSGTGSDSSCFRKAAILTSADFPLAECAFLSSASHDWNCADRAFRCAWSRRSPS